MLTTTLVIVLVLDVAWIAYAMANAPVIDDEENFTISDDSQIPD